MSRITQFAVGRRSVALLLAGAMFIAGVSAWGSLKQELLPDITFPILTVIAPYPGAGAADVAEQVAKPIERAIGSVPRLERIQSTSANSLALIVAQFSFGTDVKEVRAAIEQNLVTAGLPAGVTATVTPLNINASPVVVASIAATSGTTLERVAHIARTEIVAELAALDGVARADLTGGLEQRLVVTLDPDKLASAGISIQQIVGLLQANNLTFPSGTMPTGSSKIPVSTVGRFESVDAIKGLIVKAETAAVTGAGGAAGSSGGGAAQPATPAVTLGELGSIETVGVATTGYGLTNGNSALTLTVSKTSSGNTVDVATAVQARLADVAARHPGELSITTVSDQSTYIEESRDGLLREGGLGALFAVLTIFLFLFNLRSTVVAAVSIPLSVLTALVAMQLTGVTINIMTLGGLAVAVGRVVDDAIVVLENIYRHRALGDDRLTSVLAGPREVAGAITASTITTVGVFLPLGFVGGLVSQFFLPFALTVTFALLASLVVALTIVPVLAFLLIDRVRISVDASGEPTRSIWVRVYTPTIHFVLRNRRTKWAVLAAAAALFIAATSLAPLLPTQFINAGSEKVLQVTVSPPSGASSQAVLERTRQAETLLAARPEVEIAQASIPGEGDVGLQTLLAALSGRPANSATITVRFDPKTDLDAETIALANILAPVRTDGYDVTVGQAGGFTSNTIDVIVSGADPAGVETAATAILDALRGQAGLANLKSDLARATPSVSVAVDPNKAIGVGMTAVQVAGEVRSALVGQIATRASIAGGQPVPVFVQLDPARVTSVEQLQALSVGITEKVALGSIATVAQVDAQGTITRVDQAPAATITAAITSKDTGAISRAVQKTIDGLKAAGAIPAGVTAELAGVTQQQSEAFGGLFASMGVAILLVYVAMVLTFNSLITPFIILFSLPLATIGAFPALYFTGRPIGVSALIGFLMLIGIVVTNAIVLLDLVERLRARGMSTQDALMEGGRTRVRPILMTAIATILALMPLAAGFSEGSIIAAELGTVVIGGLFTSTFLTLIVIPVIYSLVQGGKDRASRRGAGAGVPAGASALDVGAA